MSRAIEFRAVAARQRHTELGAAERHEARGIGCYAMGWLAALPGGDRSHFAG
jgi:hypothetical protein